MRIPVQFFSKKSELIANMKEGRFSLTVKFVILSVIIISAFAFTAIFLFQKVHSMIHQSSIIVQVHYHAVDISEDMIDQLISVTEYKKRYEILKKEEDKLLFLQELRQFIDKLNTYVSLSSVKSSFDQFSLIVPNDIIGQDGTVLKDDSASYWLEIFTIIRDHHRAQMVERLKEMESIGKQAKYVGYLGLGLCSFIVIAGTLFLVFRIRRSAKELKHGLQRVGHKEQLEPIEVVSNDELGDLSIMFNEMIQRLQKEEEKRADFISMLSHEIRTPLTSISEALSMIQEQVFGPTTEKQDRYVSLSLQEVERLNVLLKRLLYVSSMDEQGVSLHSRLEPIRDLIQGGLERIQPTAEMRGISVVLNDSTNNSMVLADKDHLQQVIVNLVGNALKFSPAGGEVRVTIQNSQSKGQVIVTIHDHGPGIPENDRPYVFDRFYRGHGIRSKVDGSGLGLNISRRIIRAHGGDVWLEEGVVGGSAFSFSLPMEGGPDA
jgi:signal transduction histidine kinase